MTLYEQKWFGWVGATRNTYYINECFFYIFIIFAYYLPSSYPRKTFSIIYLYHFFVSLTFQWNGASFGRCYDFHFLSISLSSFYSPHFTFNTSMSHKPRRWWDEQQAFLCPILCYFPSNYFYICIVSITFHLRHTLWVCVCVSLFWQFLLLHNLTCFFYTWLCTLLLSFDCIVAGI